MVNFEKRSSCNNKICDVLWNTVIILYGSNRRYIELLGGKMLLKHPKRAKKKKLEQEPQGPARPACHFLTSKSEIHRMTSEWPQTLKCQNVPCIHWMLTPAPPEFYIGVQFALRPAIFQIQDSWRWRCTEWPHNQFNFSLFRSTNSRDIRLQIISNAPYELRVTLTT